MSSMYTIKVIMTDGEVRYLINCSGLCLGSSMVYDAVGSGRRVATFAHSKRQAAMMEIARIIELDKVKTATIVEWTGDRNDKI